MRESSISNIYLEDVVSNEILAKVDFKTAEERILFRAVTVDLCGALLKRFVTYWLWIRISVRAWMFVNVKFIVSEINYVRHHW